MAPGMFVCGSCGNLEKSPEEPEHDCNHCGQSNGTLPLNPEGINWLAAFSLKKH